MTHGVVAKLRVLGLKGLLAEMASKNTPTTIAIDFSSPNIAKQFHIGNLRSTLIGRFTTTIQRVRGQRVHSVNYLGDWGTQMAVITAYWPKVRPSGSFWFSANDEVKIRLLTDCYVLAHRQRLTDPELREQISQQILCMEDSLCRGDKDDESLRLWKEIYEVSERHLNHFYRAIRVEFDTWLRESEEVPATRQLVEKLLVSGAVRRDELNRIVYPLSPDKYAVIQKSNAASLYLTRDAVSLLRRDSLLGASRYLYVVDRAQKEHFEALRKVVAGVGREDLAERIQHVSYGRVKGLSTRLGRTEAVSEILQSGREIAASWMAESPTRRELDLNEKKAAETELALSSLVVSELRRARNSDYEFSWRNAFSEKHSNALLLHSHHSRLCSIEQLNHNLLTLAQKSVLSEEEGASCLLSTLAALPDAVQESADRLESHFMVNAILALARESGRAALALRVKDQPEAVAGPRLALLSLTRRTLAEAMQLLSINPLTKM